MIEQILKKIQSCDRFLVCAHANPDGDAIGSTIGLMQGLLALGKQVVAYNADSLPATFAFLPGADQLVCDLRDEPPFDVAFVLDAGSLERAQCPQAESAACLINIDHHPGSDFGHICMVDTSAAATALLVYQLLKQTALSMTPEVALPLYTGLLSDTGSFRYANSNPEAFAVAGELVALGINPWKVASALYETQAPERMRLLAQVLETLNISSCGRYASVYMTQEMLKNCSAQPEHADGFVNYPRAIAGVEVAVFIRELEDASVKLSLRSRDDFDVRQITTQLGGGGHRNAAGAKLDLSVPQALERVLGLLHAAYAG